MLMNAHVIEWMWWEFKKDKAWYWFPLRNPPQIIDFKAV